MDTDSVRKLNLQGHISIPNSEILDFLAVIFVFLAVIPESLAEIPESLAEKVSDPRPRVARPAPAVHTTRARGSRDPRARVADFLKERNGNLAIWNGTYRTLLACGSA